MKDELNSYFSKGIKMNGVLKFKGALRFDGDFQGEIQTKDTFIVGNSGKVSANVVAGTVYNLGKIVGNVKAGRKVSILANSQLTGNIDTPILFAEEGAIFQGSCVMPFDLPRVVSAGDEEELREVLAADFPEALKKKASAGKNQRRGTAALKDFAKQHRTALGAAAFVCALLVFGTWFVTLSKNEIMGNTLSRLIYKEFAKGDYDRLAKLADTWFEEGDFHRATDTYRLLREISPGDTFISKKLAESLENTGNMKEATSYYEKYLGKNPGEKETIRKLSEFYSSEDDIDGQIRILEIILANSSDNRTAAGSLFHLYRSSKMTEKALSLYQERLVSDPVSPKDLMTIGGLQMRLDRLDGAIKSFEQLVSIDPRDLEGHLALAYAYHKSGAEWKSASNFRFVGRLNPDHVEALNNTAFKHLTNGNVDKAIEYFNIALVRNPNNLRALHGLANTYSRKGENERAEYYCKKVLKIDPSYAPSLNRLAWIYAMEGKNINEAEKLSLASMKYTQNLPGYMDTLSEVYYRKNNYEKAIEWINRALKLDPGNSWFKSQQEKFFEARDGET